jgi:Ca-activated chloride channel homolog
METTKYTEYTKHGLTGRSAGGVATSVLHFRPSLPFLSCNSCILWLFLSTLPAFGSPSSALREYNAGKYDQAYKAYERLLQKKSDDPRLHFNAGAAAYRNQQFEEAAKQFNATLASPDLKLQGLAYYNEGNALYHLGERATDPKKRTEAWEKALQDYQSTMKLSGQDPDAKHNYEFVKKRLEELKQQQQQSKNDKSDKQKNQDQQQQQDQQKKDEQQQQQAQQNQSEQKKDSSQQQQQAEQKKQEEQKQAANQAQEQKDKQQQAQQAAEPKKDKGDEKEQEAAAAQAAGQMTQQQAQQLLDAQKGDEQMLPLQQNGKPGDRTRSVKDW